MFGISDPGIWLAYLLAFACLLFSIWFGITTWNKEDDEKQTLLKNHENEYANIRHYCHYLHVCNRLVRVSRIQADENASDYLLGGRKVNPIIMALSYGATFISASAIVGFGGVAATFGMGIQWLCLLNMFMGVVVAFIFSDEGPGS